MICVEQMCGILIQSWDSLNKSWCPLPWNSVQIRIDGRYGVCTHSFHGESKGYLGTDVSECDPAVALEHATLNVLRKDMMNNIQNDICTRCNQDDQHGIRSRRMHERSLIDLSIEDLIKNTREDGSLIDPSLEDLDVSWGNLCNLKCRMCSPQVSSAWYEDQWNMGKKGFHVDGKRIQLIDPDHTDIPYGDWPKHTDFLHWDLSSVKRMHMEGGEPLLLKNHLLFLDKFIEQGISHDIQLMYNTNLTKLHRGILDRWEQFKEIVVTVSIDALREKNDYIRHGSKWEEIEENIEILKTLPNVYISATVTAQIYNVLDLPEIVQYLNESGFQHININALRRPQHLSIQSLRGRDKSVINRLIKMRLNCKKNDAITSILNFMLEDIIPAENFLEWTEQLDSIRNESFKETFPLLHRILTK